MNNGSINNFGSYIKYLRTKKEMSQRDLSEKTEIAPSEICKIENGDRQKPSAKHLRALAPVLGVPLQDLLYRAGYIDDVNDETFNQKEYIDSMGNQINMSFLVNSIYGADIDLLPLLKKLTDRYDVDDLDIVKGLFKTLTADAISAEEKKAMLIILSKFLKV